MKDKDKSKPTFTKALLMSRITELRDSGKSWPEVTKCINAEGFLNEDREPFKARSLETKYRRWTKAKDKEVAAHTSADIGHTDHSLPTSQPESGMTLHADSMTEVTPTYSAESGQIDATGDSVPVREVEEPGHTETSSSGLTHELQALITAFMEKELTRILAGGVTVTEVQKSGKGGVTLTEKKSFTIPKDVWNEFEIRFRGSILSNHVTAALRMYLKVTRMEGSKEAEQVE